ncbi:MAG TPA: tetratricopeptide repeat protein, partial [Kofleriaceae bacterium]
ELAIPRSPASESVVVGPPIEPSGVIDKQLLQPPQPASAASASPAVEAGPNPFDDQVWRAEGGSDSSADVAGAHPIVSGGALAGAIAWLKNKRNLAIVGGAVVLLVVVIAMMSGGSDKPSSKASATAKKSAKSKSEPAAKTAAAETAPAAAPTEVAAPETPSGTPGETPSGTPGESPSGTPGESHTGTPGESPAEAHAGTPPAETRPAETTHGSPTEAHAATATHASDSTEHADHATDTKPKKTGYTIGGKPVVLEYDTQAREGKPVPNAPKEDQAAIGKARTSYAAGNTRLFAGDAEGAIKNYRQALAYYPAYVAAYRGLGLAYAQKGDNAAAAKALRTYVGAAPGAKDAAIIRKRIQSLGK